MKKIADIENRSFADRNGSRAGRSIKTLQNISSRNTISRDSLNSLVQKVTNLQEEFIDIDKSNLVMQKNCFMDTYITLLFHIPELVALSQTKV